METRFEGEIISYGDPFQAVRKANNLGILQVAITLTNNAKDLAAFDLGQMRNGVMYKVPGMSSGVVEGGFNDGPGKKADQRISVYVRKQEGYVGVAVTHGIYQEFGTRYMAPQPFMRPAGALTAGQSQATVLANIQREQMNGTLRNTPVGQRVVF